MKKIVSFFRTANDNLGTYKKIDRFSQMRFSVWSMLLAFLSIPTTLFIIFRSNSVREAMAEAATYSQFDLSSIQVMSAFAWIVVISASLVGAIMMTAALAASPQNNTKT